MKMLILTANDATLLRLLLPSSCDRSPDYVEKAWEKREREAADILRRIIEAIEGDIAAEEEARS